MPQEAVGEALVAHDVELGAGHPAPQREEQVRRRAPQGDVALAVLALDRPAVAAGAEVAMYSPNEVKLAVAGDGAADKDAVQRMVQQLLGLAKPPRPPDAADAAALALCHLAHAPMRRRVAAATATSASVAR